MGRDTAGQRERERDWGEGDGEGDGGRDKGVSSIYRQTTEKE